MKISASTVAMGFRHSSFGLDCLLPNRSGTRFGNNQAFRIRLATKRGWGQERQLACGLLPSTRHLRTYNEDCICSRILLANEEFCKITSFSLGRYFPENSKHSQCCQMPFSGMQENSRTPPDPACSSWPIYRSTNRWIPSRTNISGYWFFFYLATEFLRPEKAQLKL